jgi:hypothetical protein
MFRFATSSPALIEAHAQAERARYELDAEIREAFAKYDELERRLRAFDGRLEEARAHLRKAGCLGNDRMHPDFGRRPLKRKADLRLRVAALGVATFVS